MKKIILIGRSECGKTTLTQALKGEKIHYHKTQYVNRFDVIIDTPGEYGADPDRAESWLRLAGCETIFRVDSKTGEGVWKIIDYLREDGDVLPWDEEEMSR